MHTHTSSAQTKSRRRAARTHTQAYSTRSHSQSGTHTQAETRVYTYTHTSFNIAFGLRCELTVFFQRSVVLFSFVHSFARPSVLSSCAYLDFCFDAPFACTSVYIFVCMCMLGLFDVCVCLNMYKNGLPTQNNPLAAGLVSGSKSKRQPLSCILSHFIYTCMHRYICVWVSVSVCFNESIFYYLGYELEATSLPSALLFLLFFLFCFTHVFDYNIYLYAHTHMYVCMYIFLYTSICFMYLQNLLIACLEY